MAPVHRCARAVCCVACAVSWASWLLFTDAPARCAVLRVRCPGPLGSCSPVCPRGVLCCVRGVLGHLAPVHRCARSVCRVACTVSWAPWLLFTGAPARCAVLRVRCPGPPGSCSPVCPLGVLCCVCGVLGLLAPVQWCARSVCRVACTVSWAPWLLFTGAYARCAVLCARCPGPLGSCSPVCRACSVFCFVCAASWATGLLFAGVLAWFVHRCARSVCCVACAVSWAPWLLFTGVPAGCVVLCVRCPGPLGSCSPVRQLGVVLCVRGVLGRLAPVHRCACSVRCFVCGVSWAVWLLLTGVSSRCAGLCVHCPGPSGSCSLVCPAVVSRPFVALGARACAVSWHSWCLFTGVRAVCGARAVGWCVPLSSPPNFRFFLFFWKFEKRGGARTLQAQARAAGAAVQSCCVLWHVSFVLWRRSRPRGAARVSCHVHGYGSGWVRLGVSLLLVLAGQVAVWVVGVGCGNVAPSAGLVRGQGLVVLECGSGLVRVGALAGLGGSNGCGLGCGAFGRSGARWRVRWRPSASGSLGVF